MLLWMAVHYMLGHWIVWFMLTPTAPPAGLNFQKALLTAVPQSSSTISSLLLVAIILAVESSPSSYSASRRGWRWTTEFPPMPTKRWGSTALCTGITLIIAGGKTEQDSELKTVEIMNTATKQWSTAADLPQPTSFAPAAVCGNQFYILGEV